MNLKFIINKTFLIIDFYCFYLLILPILKLVYKVEPSAPWIIGGHRGRLFEDNSGALALYINDHTSQDFFWISDNSKLTSHLDNIGIRSLSKNSLAARIALLKAPVIVYSHGEDDLDEKLLYSDKKISGKRIYLNHCLAILKAGQCLNPTYSMLTAEQKIKFQNSITSFDYFFTSSNQESKYLKRSFPHLKEKIFSGGGAHLDYFFKEKPNVKQEDFLFYFPTFRDKDIDSSYSLEQIIDEVMNHLPLLKYLESNNLKLKIGSHINRQNSDQQNLLHPHIELVESHNIKENLLNCKIFISDFSGIQGDYLVFEKPIIHFPFDLEEYLKVRSLYTSYEDFAFGPIVFDVEQLTQVITSESYNDIKYSGKAQEMREALFPFDQPIYAQTTYENILKVLKK